MIQRNFLHSFGFEKREVHVFNKISEKDVFLWGKRAVVDRAKNFRRRRECTWVRAHRDCRRSWVLEILSKVAAPVLS